MVKTTVIKCVTISQAATNALVETFIHSYLITQHVKIRNTEYLFSLFRTQRHKTCTWQVNSALDIQVNILHDIDKQSTRCCQRCIFIPSHVVLSDKSVYPSPQEHL